MTDSRFLASVACLVALSLSSCSANPNYLIALPRELQCCKPEKVLVSVFTANSHQVPIRLQVADDSGIIVTQTDEHQVTKGIPKEFSLTVPCNNLPKPTDVTSQRFVTVKATSSSHGFLSSTRIAVRFSPSLVLIQTDKPVYTKNDEVNIRVAVLGCNFVPCCGGDGKCVCDVLLDIKNPQNIITDRITIKPCAANGAITRKKFKLGLAPMEGDWSIIAKRTCDDTVISETNFDVKNYVLPRFDVKLAPPKFVKPGDANIEIRASAKYTYGKGVVGFLDVKLGVCNDSSTKVLVFKQARFYLTKGDLGSKTLTFPNNGYEVFPLGKKLCVIVEATEKASGIKYGTSDNSAMFTENPIKIDCDLTSPFYRPNLPLQMQIRARYPNGEVVENVEVQVTQPDGNIKKQTTSAAGLAEVAIDMGNSHGDQYIKVKVKDQALGIECRFKEFCSPCNGQITVRPKDVGKQKVGTTADFEIIKANDNRQLSVTALVVARGSIQSSQSFQSQRNSPVTTFQVSITPQLANRFCVLVYYLEVCNQVIADVACVETDKACANEISLGLTPKEGLQPGGKLAIDINVDCPHSDVALLAVDKGLYILNNENKLSRDKLFQALDGCSRSCGHTVASSEGIFDVVGLTGISPTSTMMNPSCSCCTQTCRNACLLPDDQCSAAGRRKRSTSLDNQCNELRTSAKAEKDKYGFCLAEYKKVVEGRSGNDLSETDARELYTCCLGSDLRARANVPSEYNDIIEAEDPTLIRRRTSFPHVWLQDEPIANGELTTITKHVTVPDSITEWSIYGLAQCCATGFCVSEPVSLKVFKPVFVECHLPYSLKRQEQVSISCSAYNFNAYPQRACLKLIRPPKNLCTSAGAGEETSPVCFTIEPTDTRTVLIPVLPLEVGTTKLTVRLLSELGGDEIEKEILVEPEGITRDYDYRAELDPEGVNVQGKCIFEPPPDIRNGTCYTSVSSSGSCKSAIDGHYTKDECCRGLVNSYSLAWSGKDSHECELCDGRNEFRSCGQQHCPCGGIPPSKVQVNYFYVRAPEDYIEGSDKAWLGVSGKYFTAGEEFEGNVNEVQGVEGMLRMPGGCGEQSMLRFGPNCAIVSFLAATNPGSEEAHINILREGYQYQLQYRKMDDGGFCVWEGHDASTWLSSFVLRTMCCARKFIEVDPDVVSGLINFLGTRRDANGRILEPKTVYHREMVGGVQEGGVSMTAYTVMSLLECCKDEEKPILMKVCPSVQYMQRQVGAGIVNRPYAQAIVYLALVKACNSSSCSVCRTQGVCDMAMIAKLRRDLFAKRIIGGDGSVHWEADARVGKAYWYSLRPDAISVELTAYVLEACMAISDCQTAASIAKWLNSARNSRGAFVSTQDTVVALNALSKFAAGCKITTTHPPNLCVKVTRMSSPDKLFASFNVTSKNAALTQRIPIDINDFYKVETCGTGLGQTMVHVEYNVPGTKIEQCAFNMTVNAQEVQLSNPAEEHNAAEVEFYVRYLKNGCTSMAIVEVELPTGYQPCEALANDASDPLCLRDIMGSDDNLLLDKYEVTGKSVVFYFEHLCNDSEIRIKFKAYREFEVMHSLPVSIKAYDYYEPDEQCTDFYTLGGGSPELGLICDDSNKDSPTCICGAGRCPKLEEIQNRLCNACIHHHFVYKVVVLKIIYSNGWWKYKVNVSEILKPGRTKLKAGEKINLWLPAICKLKFDLRVNSVYHLQGLDGNKFVLDHNTQVELWPESTAKECKQNVKQQCIKEPCKKYGTKKKIKDCEKKRKRTCENKLEKCDRFEPFDTYVNKLKDGGICESNDVCDQ